MTEQESWQVSDDAAEIYEQFWVPAMLGQWAPQVVDAAKITVGDRVLDVACGTGIVARKAKEKLQHFLVDNGEVVIPMDAYIITARIL